MAFWRSAAYVARRLGREFLIWGAVALVVYVVADQILLHRYQTALTAWTAEYDARFPAPPQPSGNGAAEAELIAWGDHFKSRAGKDLHELKSDEMLSVLASEFLLLGSPLGGIPKLHENQITELEYALAEDIDPLSDALDAAAACGAFQWFDTGAPEAHLHDRELFSVLRYVLAMSLVLMHAEESDRAVEALVRVGKLIPMMTPPDAGRSYLFQDFLTTRLLAALRYGLAQDAIGADEAAALSPVLASLWASPAQPLRMQSPAYFESSHLELFPGRGYAGLQRLLRPYTAHTTADILRMCLRLSETMELETLDSRAESYHEMATSESGVAAYWYAIFLHALFQYEVRQADLAVSALMLELEERYQRTGHYPETLNPIEEFVPMGFDPRSIAVLDLMYTPDGDRLGYQISRRVPRFNTASQQAVAVMVEDVQSWTRRRTDSSFALRGAEDG